MGFKAIDITPIASYGPTSITPASKDVAVKAFAINRTDTVASVKCVLPADATILDMRVYTATASDAATTATISVGLNGGSGTAYLNTVDVKTAAGMIRPTTKLSGIMGLENTPLGADIALTGVYAETGGASTTGGPFYVIVEYVR
jgi:hypothetical protein